MRKNITRNTLLTTILALSTQSTHADILGAIFSSATNVTSPILQGAMGNTQSAYIAGNAINNIENSFMQNVRQSQCRREQQERQLVQQQQQGVYNFKLDPVFFAMDHSVRKKRFYMTGHC